MREARTEDVLRSEGGLAVRYRGDEVNTGRMSVEDFLPAVRGLERILQRAAYLTTQEDVEPRVFITAEFRRSSFEFHLTLEQIVPAAIALLHADNARSAIEVVSKVFSAAGSLLDLLKQLHGTEKKDITRTTLRDGSVQYNINIEGNHNTITVSAPIARMEQDVVVREALAPVVEPLLHRGVDEVEFISGSSDPPSIIAKREATYFSTPVQPKPLDDSFQIVEQVLTVVKPSFVDGRRWRFRNRDLEFGADMDDRDFQRKVTRREMLFGTGDQLRVQIAIRLHRAKHPEYRVQKVLEIIRPEEPPMQLGLG